MHATKPAALRATSRLLRPSKGQPVQDLPNPLDKSDYLSRARRHLQPGVSRPIYDYLSPTPSHLLNTSLAGLIPPEMHYPKPFRQQLLDPKYRQGRGIPGGKEGKETEVVPLPIGHHLVYFGPQATPGELLPDGTEAHTAPGAPFTRRMWAGGRVRFVSKKTTGGGKGEVEGKGGGLKLDCTRAVCVEQVVGDPVIKGIEGQEKVFVEISRKYGRIHDYPTDELTNRIVKVVEDGPDIEETRTLVFMREPEPASHPAANDDNGDGQVAAPGEGPKERDMTRLKRLKDRQNWTPIYSFTLVPDKQLLFQFSALTFNAHRIHLDQRYAQEVEGHRDLLVHGPLSLALMLMAVRAQADCVEKGEGDVNVQFRELNYRNLAPLYVDEEMKVCVRHRGVVAGEGEEQYWDVWVERPDGGFAVKGMATMHVAKRLA